MTTTTPTAQDSGAGPDSGAGRTRRPVLRTPVLAGLTAVAATFTVLWLTRGTAWVGLGGDAFAMRYLLPGAQTVMYVAAATTVGLLLAIVFLVPDRSRDPWALTGTREHAARWAASSALVWFCSGLMVLLLSLTDQSGVSLSSPGMAGQLVFFIRHVQVGQILTTSLVLVLLVCNLALSATR